MLNIKKKYILLSHVAYGKSGKRIIKLINQAQEILSGYGITIKTLYHTSSRKKLGGLVSQISGFTTCVEPLVII